MQKLRRLYGAGSLGTRYEIHDNSLVMNVYESMRVVKGIFKEDDGLVNVLFSSDGYFTSVYADTSYGAVVGIQVADSPTIRGIDVGPG